jgi:hypothetical protein
MLYGEGYTTARTRVEICVWEGYRPDGTRDQSSIRSEIRYLILSYLIGPELHTGGNDGDARLSLYMWECYRWTGIGADTVSHGHIVGDRECVAEGFVKAHSTQ